MYVNLESKSTVEKYKEKIDTRRKQPMEVARTATGADIRC